MSRKGRPLLVALAGAAAFGVACSAPYPPGNLLAPMCPDGGPYPCQQPDAGKPDGGATDAGTSDGGRGADQ